VFIGDTLHVTAEITETSEHAKQPERFGYVHELVTVANQDGHRVLVLTHLYLVNKRGS
jgi:acyl dehydratase